MNKSKGQYTNSEGRDLQVKSMEDLIADLRCEGLLKCQAARRELVNVGQEAVQPLIKVLQNHDEKQWTRWEATKALGQIADPEATRALIIALRDQNFDIRWLAAEALVSIGRPAIVPLLQELLDHSEYPWLRLGAHHVFSDINLLDVAEILRPVVEALDGIAPSDVPLTAKAALDVLK